MHADWTKLVLNLHFLFMNHKEHYQSMTIMRNLGRLHKAVNHFLWHFKVLNQQEVVVYQKTGSGTIFSLRRVLLILTDFYITPTGNNLFSGGRTSLEGWNPSGVGPVAILP